jgi:integrase
MNEVPSDRLMPATAPAGSPSRALVSLLSPLPDASELSARSLSGQRSRLGGHMTESDVWRVYQRLLQRRKRSPATIALYQVVLHDLWGHLDGLGVRWDRLTPEDVDAWLERACKSGKHGAGLALQDGSRNTYGRIAKRCYRLFAERGWLQGNPLEDWEPPPPPGPRPRALPVEAIGQLLLRVDPRIRMMVLIGYHQALRVGETVKLRVEDIILGADPPMLLVHGKGGRRVWMPLSRALVPPLRAWLVTRPPSGPLIPNYRDPTRHLDPKYATALLAASMRPVVGDSGHALRRTAAQQLRRLTHDPFVVRDALRQSSLGMLDIYVEADKEALGAALARLPNPLAQEVAE